MSYSTSRLLLTEVVRTNTILGNKDRNDFVAYRKRTTKEDSTDYRVAISGANDWAFLGYRRLDDARNWWVIGDLSDTVDAFTEFTEGSYVRVPTRGRFIFNIMNKEDE